MEQYQILIISKIKFSKGSKKLVRIKWSLATHISFLDNIQHEQSLSNVTKLPEKGEFDDRKKI